MRFSVRLASTVAAGFLLRVSLVFSFVQESFTEPFAQAPKDPLSVWPFYLFLAAAIGLAAAVRLLAARRQPSVPSRPPRLDARPGEDPSTAISIFQDDEMLRNLFRLSCRCGKRFDLDDSRLHETILIYDGNRITAFRLRCSSCRAERDVYFKKRTPFTIDSPL